MIKNFLISLVNFYKFFLINKKEKDFVFYSESKYYREHFIDLINSLIHFKQKKIIFITSDFDDYHFFKDKIKCFYVPSVFFIKVLFITLNCRFLIMTLTDLGNHLLKSKNCEKYVYFFHALASTHEIYTNTAFSNYDIILSNGKYQEKELIFNENLLNTPKKEIINTGYFFLDYIKNNSNQDRVTISNILFAPSWNYNETNLFNNQSINIIETLLRNNFSVTLRPHPEHYKRSITVLKKIKKHFYKDKNFLLDNNLSNIESMEKAELIITDNSSIVFEYVLIFKRPIIYIDYKKKIHNIDRKKIPIKTIEDEFRKIFGKKISWEDLNDLPNLCMNLIKENKIDKNKVDTFIKQNISNFGFSANFAASYLIKKLNY